MSNKTRGTVGVANRFTNPNTVNNLEGKSTIEGKHCPVCLKKRAQKHYKVTSDFYFHLTGKKEKPFGDCILCNDARRNRNDTIKRARERGIHLDKNLRPIPQLPDTN